MTRYALRAIVGFAILASGSIRADEPAVLPIGKFTATYSPAGDRPYDDTNLIGEFTINGPSRDTLKPLPKGILRVAYDPDQKVYYGISRHSVFELDLTEGTAKEIKPEFKGEREFVWACGITFDTQRKRLIVVSLSGLGYIYSYSPKEKEWTVIADTNNVDYSAIAYAESSDTLFAIHHNIAEKTGPTLSRLNSAGAVVNTTELKHRQLAESIGIGPVESHTQIVPAKDQLIVIVAPIFGRTRKAQIYVINQKDSSVIEAWRE